MPEVALPSVAETLGEAFDTFAKCTKLFTDAQLEKRIYFDDQVVSTGLEIVAQLSAKAAKLNQTDQNAFLVHWIRHGPSLCQEIITRVERRNPPVLHRDDLVGKLIKEH